MNKSSDIQTAGISKTDYPEKHFFTSHFQSAISLNTHALPGYATLLPTLITRYDDEFFQTNYPEEGDLPKFCPTFYEATPDTVWIRNNDEDSFFERGDIIRFPLGKELPPGKDLVVDGLEVILYETGDDSGLTVDLYLDNRKVASIPYTRSTITGFDLALLNISEKDRTLSLRKNLMVKFKKNGRPYMKMGIGYASPGKPAGRIKGRLKTRTRLLPQSTCQCLIDHNKNITGLVNDQGQLVATWDYDAFGNIIQQTGALADRNPLRFSSEYHDEDLGLIYYNYRHYNPKEGRWINRDSIEEEGGNNLYSFISNYALTRFDSFGLMECGMGAISNGTFGDSNPPSSRNRCQEKRENAIAQLEKLESSHNQEEPECGKGCTPVAVYVNIADPCDMIPYGHAGIGVGTDYSDMGPWSMLWPSMRPWHAGSTKMTSTMDQQSVWNSPTVSIKFCACKERAYKIKQYWRNLNNIMNRPVHLRPWWTPLNNCATTVAESLGVDSVLIPDDLLENVDSNFSNECGDKKGTPPSIKLIHSNFPKKK